MEHLFDRKLEPIQERLDQVEEKAQRKRTPQSPQRNRGLQRINEDELYGPIDAESDQGSNLSDRRRGPRNRGQRERGPIRSGGLSRVGEKIELVFECHNYSKTKKVKLAAIEFLNYAMIWWDQLTSSHRKNEE
ncbi:mutant gag-pol polyprotein [Gossypium australe]|uniref:Mutant gag-pol polyprotein n=1 Tax=Gossypium australe TaxID=47621 RepID=A0A5B6WFG6_9ROSI|nr:mutant gag-pol polyprotein [Gossypium australe]